MTTTLDSDSPQLQLTHISVISGHSPPSEPTTSFQTIQATPETPPPEVTVRAVNETALRVRWKVGRAPQLGGEYHTSDRTGGGAEVALTPPIMEKQEKWILTRNMIA